MLHPTSVVTTTQADADGRFEYSSHTVKSYKFCGPGEEHVRLSVLGLGLREEMFIFCSSGLGHAQRTGGEAFNCSSVNDLPLSVLVWWHPLSYTWEEKVVPIEELIYIFKH